MYQVNKQISKSEQLSSCVFLVLPIFISILQCPFWRNFFVECARNFQHYFILVLLAQVVAICFRFKKFGAAKGFIYILIHFLALVVLYKPISIYFERSESLIPESSLARFKIFYVNLELGNNSKKILESVKAENPDIVALLEPNASQLNELDFKSKYPYSIQKPLDNKFGLALYSKFKFTAEPTFSLGSDLPGVIIVPVRFRGKEVRLVLVHAIPPLNNEAYYQDRILFRRLATYIKNQTGNILIMGDFNGTVYSYFYQILKEGANLQDAKVRSGFAKTWKARSPFLHLIIDHVLYAGDLKLLNFKVGQDIDSDHYPLIAVFN
ncbi:MAG: endonuclease/exonuclease/phosphatase family protein [Bdellovibrionales bacterium]|nr:endonuclease/exonuclease/phosphatase family protein [Bdellovibrionales bacterium]